MKSAAGMRPAPVASPGARKKLDTSRGPRCPRWAPDEDEQMRMMAERGHTKHDVADALGRTVNAVAARAVMIRVHWRYVSSAGAGRRTVPDLLRRRCLHCREMFETESKYLFVCDVCHAAEEWRCYDLEPM